MKKKVFILTNFQQFLKSYSPIIVVQGQLEMLTRAGYDPVLVTNRGFNPPEASIFASVENKQITPVVIDGSDVDQKFEADVEMLRNELLDILEDDCIVITHDLIFLPDYVKLNVASREVAKQNNTIQWLHWVHSATNPQDLIKERAMFAGKYAEHLGDRFPNSLICFPNAYDIPRAALNFGYEEPDVVEVPHPTDLSIILSPRFKRLWWEKQLHQVEMLTCYPLRLDRGKQPEMHIRLMAGFKTLGVSSHVVFCDFQSTGGDKVTYREELKRIAEELDVAGRVTFISEFDESAAMEVAQEEVLLFQVMCNFFMCPSKSETYSLVTQEAMVTKNFCILNQDFAPFRQIYGNNAIYKPFSANIAPDGYNGSIDTTYNPDKQTWFRDLARTIVYYVSHEKSNSGSVYVRTQRNYDYIFKRYLEPLFYRETDNAEILSDTARLQ